MSTSATSAPCTCRLPWAVAVLAVVLAGAWSLRPAPPAVATATVAQGPDALAAARHDLAEARRVLDDALSALAQRDREIAAASDELRQLREELARLRPKP